MIVAFVPVRLRSSRLPNKAIQEIYGVSAIERCLINTMAIPGVDEVVLATSTNAEDDILLNYNLGGKVEVVRGPEDDVLERFMPTIHNMKPDHVIRVTGDCPLVSTELGELTIKKHLKNGRDATFTLSKVALGIACEIYKTDAILKLRRLVKNTNHSEYLIFYFLNNPKIFSLNIFDAPEKFIKPWRLTLDESNDLELLNLIFSKLKIDKRPVKYNEIVSFFNKLPEAAKINAANVIKYRDNQQLIENLRKVTTINPTSN